MEKLKKLQEKIDLYKKIIQVAPKEELKKYNQAFAIEFTHNSTAIEGNTKTLLETKMILEDKIIPSETSEREYNEIYNNDLAFQLIQEKSIEKLGINEDLVKDIHSKVMDRMEFGTPGLYRNVNVTVGGATHDFVDYTRVRQEMKNFVADYKEKEKRLSPIEKSAWVHAEFVRIHPFPDGNGRTARLLMNNVLLENEYPPIAIKKDQVKEYFFALDLYGSSRDTKPFQKLIETTLHKELDRFTNHFREYTKEQFLTIDEKSPQIKSQIKPPIVFEKSHPAITKGRGRDR